jgi:hypothetical protein
MAVLLATFSHSVWWAKPGTSRASANAIRDRVLAAAKSCTVAANAYSYQTFDVDETKGEQCLTGVQVSRYKSAMAAIKSDVLKVKASQVPQINDAGIESITANGKQWGIVVYGQLSITQTGTGSTPRIDPFAAYVRMDYVHGKWLMSSLCTIGGTGQC